jgi:hypothetical protein
MANFTAGTSFSDGVTNDVTAAKLNALVADAVPTSNLSLNSTTGTIATLNSTTGTIATLNSTTGTIATLNSTTGTIATLNSTTGTIATLNSTTGTIATLNSTTGTIATLNSTTGTIATLNSTTPTFLGAITASTSIINVGSGQIYKDASGNVGVGTATPSAKLVVKTGDTVTGTVTLSSDILPSALNIVGGSTENGKVGLLFSSNEQGAIGSAVISNRYPADWGTDLSFHTHTDDASALGTLTEKMRIKANGNVGVGTSSPRTKLDVSGNIFLAAGNQIQITGNSGTDGLQIIGNDASTSLIGTMNSQALALRTNATERLRIDSSGNVIIGATSPVSASSLTVFNSSNASIALQNPTNHSAIAQNGSDFYFDIGRGGSAGNLIFRRSSLLNESLRIDSSGKVGIGTASPSAQLELSTDSAKKPSTNTWTIASDQRLKTNITNADNDRCYEIVKQVPLKRYTWKSEVYSQEQVKDRSKLGWIAQDVEAVFPKAVGTNRFAYNQVFENVVTPELDSDGNAVLDENGVARTRTEKRLVSEDVIEDCKDLNSDQIYAAMYGTIQKLIEKVEFLESKVATLEAA